MEEAADELQGNPKFTLCREKLAASSRPGKEGRMRGASPVSRCVVTGCCAWLAWFARLGNSVLPLTLVGLDDDVVNEAVKRKSVVLEVARLDEHRC